MEGNLNWLRTGQENAQLTRKSSKPCCQKCVFKKIIFNSFEGYRIVPVVLQTFPLKCSLHNIRPSVVAVTLYDTNVRSPVTRFYTFSDQDRNFGLKVRLQCCAFLPQFWVQSVFFLIYWSDNANLQCTKINLSIGDALNILISFGISRAQLNAPLHYSIYAMLQSEGEQWNEWTKFCHDGHK